MADITITEGDTLEVDYNLENTGDGSGTFDPRLLVQGVQEDQDTGITLDPAQTATGTLQWLTESGDAVTDATAAVATDDTQDSILVTVEDAIPDSEANQKLVHRWVLDDVNGTVEDIVGNADGTVNGVTSVSGDWAGGSAGSADGVDDYIETTTLGGFGSGMGAGFAVALSFSGTEGLTGGSNSLFGTLNDNDPTAISIPDGGTQDRELFIRKENGSSDAITWGNSGTYEDNNPHRIVYNVPDPNDPTTWEIFADQTAESLFVETDESVGSYADFQYPVSLFARNVRGSIGANTNCILNDVCVFGEPLTSSEAQSYQNPWS